MAESPPARIMTPRKKLDQLCRRHGVPPAQAASLLPLVERALAARSPELEASLIAIVESSLRRRARDLIRGPESGRRLERTLDYQYLKAVAHVLHTWEPSAD